MNTSHLLSAIRAAIAAGGEIMSIYTDPHADFQIEKKADNSPVTIADKKANTLITDVLTEETPYPLLTEEGLHTPYENRKSWKAMWIVDPLDGTKEFIKRNGEFTVNIAYVENGVPEAGIIYIPVREELYFADMAIGAFRKRHVTSVADVKDDLEALMVSSDKLPIAAELAHKGYIVVASRSFLNDETRQFIENIRKTHPDVTTLSRGSSLKICAVAEGSADEYPRFAPTMEWDTAAGHAIIRAAGGHIYHTDGCTPLTYNKEDLHNPYFIVKR